MFLTLCKTKDISTIFYLFYKIDFHFVQNVSTKIWQGNVSDVIITSFLQRYQVFFL